MKKYGKKTLWLWSIIGASLIIGSLFMGSWAERVFEVSEEPKRAFVTDAPAPTQSTSSIPAALENSLPSATPTLPDEKVNIVFLGVDTDEERAAAGNSYRTDTIVVLAANLSTGEAELLSIPRDTRVKVQKLNDTGKVTAEQYNRINSAFYYGGGYDGHGYENTLLAVNNLLFPEDGSDSSITYYVSIDMDGIAPFVEAVGGVPITLPYDVEGFGSEGETITITAENAESFVRLRHGITGGSDLGRIGRQQAFIMAFADKVKDMGATSALFKLLPSVQTYMNTNLTMNQMVAFAEFLSKADLTSLTLHSLPGKCRTIDGRSYFIADEDGLNNLVSSIWGVEEKTA